MVDSIADTLAVVLTETLLDTLAHTVKKVEAKTLVDTLSDVEGKMLVDFLANKGEKLDNTAEDVETEAVVEMHDDKLARAGREN